MKMIKSLLGMAMALTTMTAGAPEHHDTDLDLETAVYENYSFDFSAHERPIAYTNIGNTLELVQKVKVNPNVHDRGGAYLLDTTIEEAEFEVQVEYTINGDLKVARGFMILLTQHEMLEQDFLDSEIGYRQDYEGAAVYVFRHPNQNNKWYVMTLQN